jgi:hypothetical protein
MTMFGVPLLPSSWCTSTSSSSSTTTYIFHYNYKRAGVDDDIRVTVKCMSIGQQLMVYASANNGIESSASSLHRLSLSTSKFVREPIKLSSAVVPSSSSSSSAPAASSSSSLPTLSFNPSCIVDMNDLLSQVRNRISRRVLEPFYFAPSIRYAMAYATAVPLDCPLLTSAIRHLLCIICIDLKVYTCHIMYVSYQINKYWRYYHI